MKSTPVGSHAEGLLVAALVTRAGVDHVDGMCAPTAAVQQPQHTQRAQCRLLQQQCRPHVLLLLHAGIVDSPLWKVADKR